MKRAIVAAAAVVVSMMGLGAWAVTAQASSSGNETFTLEAHQTSFHVVDAPPKGDSAGDSGTLAGNLSRDGEPVGKYLGSCVQIDAEGHSQCQFSFALPEGQLVIMSGYGPGINGNRVAREAIVGGTGHYAQARGYTVGRETGRNNGEEVIHLRD